MPKTILVEVSPLPQHSKAGKKRLESLTAFSALKGFSCRRSSPLFRLEGGLNRAEAEKVAVELLCDPVIETFSIDAAPRDPEVFFADVWFKPGVTDTVGESVLKAVRDLKIGSIEKVFAGTRYEFYVRRGGKAGEQNVRDFAERELLNPLIQECKIQKL